MDLSRGPEWATWFVGGKVNIAWNCVHRWAERRPDAIASIGLGEDGSRREQTFQELSREVTKLAEALLRLGVRRGRPGRDLPPDVAGGAGRVARLRAHRRDPGADLLRLRRAGRGAAPPGVRGQGRDHGAFVVTARARGADARDRRRGPPRGSERRARDRRAVGRARRRLLRASSPAAELDSETPYLLTYTSGTTGTPKGVVHVQGGFLVSIAREVCYQADAGPDDRIHFVTDMGWIMGPWTVVGGHAMGSTLVFAEGAPDWPQDRLWKLIEAEGVSVLGISPTLTRALIPHGEPRERPLVSAHDRHDRRALESRAVPLALRRGRRRALPDHQLLGRDRGRRLLPLADGRDPDQGVLARRPGARNGDGRRRRGGQLGVAARSASSSAASRSRG